MIGKTILHYKIIEKLGEGGMGVVYLAEDLNLERKVAIKFLPRHIAGNSEERERFRIEAKAAAALNHPNIATIHAIEESADGIFIVMEFIEGVELKDKIKSGSVSIIDSIHIAIQIAEGLEAAHKKGIIHRDIKSSNIMITNDSKVKIMDFGLAKVGKGTQVTEIGSTVGTVSFMSPEQAQGQDVDHRSDIFSFGVVLYEMLTGHLPFKGEHQAAILYSLVNENPEPIARFNSKVSTDLEKIVFKALAKDRNERYQHADDILADLRKEIRNSTYLNSSGAEGKNSSLLRKSKRETYKKVLLALGTIGAVILTLYLFTHNNSVHVSSSEEPTSSLAVMYFENIPDHNDQNHTGEMITDLLTTSLSQVKGLEVISRERLLDIQKDMGEADNRYISASFAGKIAKRAGVNTMVIGSIVQTTPTLAVTASLVDVESGKILGSQEVMNFAPNRIFNLVDSLTYLLKDQMPGVSHSIAQINSVEDVTTNSTEAYRAYVSGLDLFNKFYFKEAIGAFTKAIELDTNFAMAHFYLSIVQGLSEDEPGAENSLRKAVALSGKTTEQERLQIMGVYYQRQSNASQAIQAYEELISKYPHSLSAYLQLSFAYNGLMLNPEKSAEVLRQGLKIDPADKGLLNNLVYSLTYLNKGNEAIDVVNQYMNLAPAEPNPYDSKGDIYSWLMNYDSSRAYYKKAIELRPNFESSNKLAFYALLREDYVDARKYFQMAGMPLIVQDGMIGSYQGRIQTVGKMLLEQWNTQISLPDMLIVNIGLSYESGHYADMLKYARQYTNELKKTTDIIYGRDFLAWALVKNGKSADAEEVLDSLQKNINNLCPSVKAKVDYISALVSYEKSDNETALTKFKRVFQFLPPNHEPNIFYAITLLRNGRVEEAVNEFKRLEYWPEEDYILQTVPGGSFYWPIPQAKAHYWLGVSYEKLGDKKEALAEYKKFLEIWKNADFNSPEIKDAKLRLTKLGGSTKA